MKILPWKFHLNCHTIEFCLQTQKIERYTQMLEPSNRSKSFTLAGCVGVNELSFINIFINAYISFDT